MMGNTAFQDFIHNKWVRLVLVIDLIVIIAIVILAITTTISKTSESAILVFDVTPSDAKITINGAGDYSSQQTVQLQPGNYKVEISHPELDSKAFDVSVEKDDNAKIATFLSRDGSIDFYKQVGHLGDFAKLEEIASSTNNRTTDQDTSAAETIDRLSVAYDRLDNLPINDMAYEGTGADRHLARDITIRTSSDASCETWLCIEALMLGTDDHQVIADLLAQNNLNAEDYEIKYKIY